MSFSSVRTANDSRSSQQPNRESALSPLGVVLGLLLLSGCSADHYRRSADKEMYGIIQRAEKKVFGHTNEFTINTPYSDRKPEEILPSELIEDRLRTNRRTLTIDGAIALAVKNSREYQAQKEALYRAAVSLSDARYQYKPIFDLGGTAGAEFDGNDPDGWFTRSAGSVSISQLLRSGGRLSASLANSMLRYYTGDPDRSVLTTISVDLFQPILQGFGRNSPELENLTQAEREVVYQVRSYAFFQDDFALRIVNQYFSLLQQKDTIRNGYTNYLRRVESTKRLEARAKDREAVSQVDQARQAELSAKNSYVNALASYRNALDRFKITLGLPLGEQLHLDDVALTELEQTGLIPTRLDADSAYRIAVQKKLPILNDIDRFEDSQRSVRLAADQLRAILDIRSAASYSLEKPSDYTQFDVDKIRWEAGAELSLPFDRLRERNTYRRTLIGFEAALRNLTLTFDTLKNNIEVGVRTLEQRRQNYEIQKNALELADRRVESTTLLLQAGRVEVRDLNDALDAQIEAQINVTDAIVGYQEARLQLMLDIGALKTEIVKFWLKDHLAGFLPPLTTPVTVAEPADKRVIPPDEFFRN